MSNYSFIDMHIHSDFSDEEGCNLTVGEILTKAQHKAYKLGKDCVISITDHNSMLGVLKARKMLGGGGSNKFPNVKFVNGIEFTTDLIETNKYFNGIRALTRCHMLGYNYDENDPELIAYSMITHKMFSLEDNVGLQICASRRAVCELLNIYIPFSVYAQMTSLPQDAHFKSIFLKTTFKYLQEHKIPHNEQAVREAVGQYISNSVSYIRPATAFGRLKLSEVAKLIKDAHGELVLAHPAELWLTVDGLKSIAKQHGLVPESFYKIRNIKYGNNTDLAHVRNRKIIINSIVDVFNKVCGYPIAGFEKYHCANFSSALDLILDNIAKERGMYVTCGSDYHGEILGPENSIGNFIHTEAQNAFKNEFYPLEAEKNILKIAYLPIVDHFLNGTYEQDKTKTIFADHLGQEISYEQIRNFLHHYYVDFKVKSKQKQISSIKDGVALSTRIVELNNILARFDLLEQYHDSPKEKGKILLKLNLYVENILKVLRVLIDATPDNEFILSEPEYKQVYDLLEQVKKRFAKVIRENPTTIKDLRKDMLHYYKRKKVALSYLGELKLQPPISDDVEENTLDLNSDIIK